MVLKDTDIRKVIIIKTYSPDDMMFISNMIHDQLMGKKDYINSKIILSIGDGQNKEIPLNEIHVYIMNDCECEPIISIGKFYKAKRVTVEISVRDNKIKEEILYNIKAQLHWNRDNELSHILVTDHMIDKDEYCIRLYYHEERNSTPSLII